MIQLVAFMKTLDRTLPSLLTSSSQDASFGTLRSQACVPKCLLTRLSAARLAS